MRPCFHHDKGTFFHVFEFVRAHQRALGHLQRLGRIVFAATDRAGQHCSAAQRLGNNIRRFRGRGKTAGNRDLAVILNDNPILPNPVYAVDRLLKAPPLLVEPIQNPHGYRVPPPACTSNHRE